MYTPDEMLMLYNTGMLGYPDAPEKIAAGTVDSPLRVNVTGLKQPGYETLRGNASADVLGLKPSVNAGYMTRGDYDNFYISPSLAADLAAIRARISQRYDKTGKQEQDYSIGTDIGPLGLDYTYSVPTEGNPMHMVDAYLPIGNKGEIYGNVMSSADMPTTYGLGGSLYDVLGGELSASGEYTPDTRDIAVYGRYMKKF